MTFSMTANVKCTVEQWSQIFYETCFSKLVFAITVPGWASLEVRSRNVKFQSWLRRFHCPGTTA